MCSCYDEALRWNAGTLNSDSSQRRSLLGSQIRSLWLLVRAPSETSIFAIPKLLYSFEHLGDASLSQGSALVEVGVNGADR